MRHPTEGVLRRLLDDPAGVADADRRHVADCGHCLGDVAAMRDDAVLVGAALETGAEDTVDVSAAWRRLSTATPAPAVPDPGAARTAAPRRSAGPRGRRRMSVLRRPAAAAAAVAVVVTGAGAAAANDWLPIFRTEQIAPLSITASDLVAVPDLSAYGELEMTAEPDVRQVADAATAARESGIDLPEVTDLPRGVGGTPVYSVGQRVSATFTFSAERAARAAAEAGEALPAPPDDLDGSSVRLVAGPGLAQMWASDAGAPALVVGRAVAPTAASSGVPFEVVRDYLLSLPGMPDDIAEQLRTFAADGSTLPLPVPAEEVTTSSADVDGMPATVLTSRDRSLAAVVWVDDGLVTVVAGSLDADEVLDVAEDLQ